MSTRVNITYSIEIEKVSGEVFRIIEMAKEKIEKAFDRSRELDERRVLTRATEEDIAEIRECLAKIDFNLNDAAALINGFLNYKTTEEPPQSEQLIQKVENFKKTFLDEDAPEEL